MRRLLVCAVVAGLLVVGGCSSGSGASTSNPASSHARTSGSAPAGSASPSCRPSDPLVDGSASAREPLPRSGHVAGTDLIARVVTAYHSAPTAHFTSTTVEAGAPVVRVSGAAAYDACDDSFALQFTAAFPTTSVDARVIHNRSYLNTGTPIQGKAWLEEPGITVDQATTDLDRNVRHVARDVDPQQLTYAWITHPTGEVGTPVVLGGVQAVPVTARWSMPVRAGDLPASYAGLAGSAKTWRLSTTVWLDEHNRLVQAVHTQAVGRYRSVSTAVFSDWGAPLRVEVPPREQTLAAPGA